MTISKIKVGNTTHDLHDTRIPGIDSTPTSDSTNVITSGGVYSAIDNAIEGISQDVSDKADKVSGATNGNFAALDSNGNLADSEHKHGDYVTALGTSGNYVTWTKNGSANNLTVPFATKAQKDANGNNIVDNYIPYGGVLMPTNYFGGKKLFINSIDNAFHVADRRYWVKITLHSKTVSGVTYPYADTSKEITDPDYWVDSPIVSTLTNINPIFDGSYETVCICPAGQYMKVHIQFSPFSDSWNPATATRMSGYPYGSYYLSYYYQNTPGSASQLRVYNIYAAHTIGWHLYSPSVFSGSLSGNYIECFTDEVDYSRTCVEFIIFGKDSGDTRLTQIDYRLSRPDLASSGSTVTKYGTQSLYHNFLWYKHNDNAQPTNTIALEAESGKITAGSLVKSGGTSSQFLKADGSVDSTSYEAKSNKTTSLSSSSTDTQYPSAKVVFDSLRRSTPADAISAEFFTRTVTEDAIANIQKIYGNIVKWNQLAQQLTAGTYGGAVVLTNNADGTFTLNGTASSAVNIVVRAPIISGHKYYFAARILSGTYTVAGEIGTAYAESVIYISVSKDTQRRIGTASGTGNAQVRWHLSNGDSYTSAKCSLIFIDLTLMFGAGHEPTTVAEFEAMYPLPYYAYNAGEIVSNKATALETVGFNQWDEEWGVGSIDTANGNNTDYSLRIRSKNYIPCFPSTVYFLHCGVNATMILLYYDANKNYISYEYKTETTFSTPANCHYIRFCTATNFYGGTYNHDICINLSDPAKNGTYQPYEKHTLNLNLPTLTGKLNGAGSSVVIFPDGMMAGTEKRDELSFTKGKKRFKMFDAGSVEWSYQSNNNRFYTTSAISGALADGDCALAGYMTEKSYEDMTVFLGGNRRVYLYNASMGGDTTALANSLSGKNLIYEIPEEEYILDNALQFQYPVTAGGTETVLATTETAPMKMDVIYGNAADATSNLPSNFISVDSMKAFLNTLGTQMGGTWNMQYNNGKFEFTFSSS